MYHQLAGIKRDGIEMMGDRGWRRSDDGKWRGGRDDDRPRDMDRQRYRDDDRPPRGYRDDDRRRDQNRSFYRDDDRPPCDQDRPRYRDDDRPRYRDDDRPRYRDDDRPPRDQDRPPHDQDRPPRDQDRPRYRDDDRPHYRDDDRPPHDQDRPWYRDVDRRWRDEPSEGVSITNTLMFKSLVTSHSLQGAMYLRLAGVMKDVVMMTGRMIVVLLAVTMVDGGAEMREGETKG